MSTDTLIAVGIIVFTLFVSAFFGVLIFLLQRDEKKSRGRK